jgi:hypothetical protein
MLRDYLTISALLSTSVRLCAVVQLVDLHIYPSKLAGFRQSTPSNSLTEGR